MPSSFSARPFASMARHARGISSIRSWVGAVAGKTLDELVALKFWNEFGYRIASTTEGRALAAMALEGVQFGPSNDPRRFIWGLDRGVLTTPSGIRLHLRSLMPTVLLNTFHYEIHFDATDLRGQTVVDGGGFVGDTALYFAQRGAEVLVYEPDPGNMAILRSNLELNPDLAGGIHPRAQALGVEGEVLFHSGLSSQSGLHIRGGSVIRARSVSLETVLEGRSHVYMLKSDCKGAEFDLVKQPALRRFERLAIKYSTGPRTGSLRALTDGVEQMGFHWHIRKHNSRPIPLEKEGFLTAVQDPRP